MENIEIFKQRLENKSFSGRELSKFTAIESEFVDCRFENMNIRDACFGSGNKQTKYIGCSFDNSKFSSNVVGIARFENCSFKNVNILNFFCVDVEMIGCTISGEIAKGNFVGKRKCINGVDHINQYQGNSFSDLKLGDVGFTGIDLTTQEMPTGDDFLIIPNLDAFLLSVKRDALDIKDQELSAQIFKVLSIIELGSEGGNDQFFLDKRSFPKMLQNGVSVIISEQNNNNKDIHR